MSIPIAILNRCSKGASMAEAIAAHNEGNSNPYLENVPVEEAAPKANPIGLPIGAPKGRVELKKALKERGIEFHSKAKTDILADLYRSEVIGES